MGSIEMSPQSCAVNSQMSSQIRELNGPEVEEKLWYTGPAEYKYEEIMQNGSPELQEAVFIVTGGMPPGNKESGQSVKVS
ncbi:hypothetical protein [Paenibacillus kobensis]|uniref:hypothetical protein n=1 Tax=Paenibacillus kobensis TaxID=59841 RepID=UPI000FDCD6EE|nr:hypothetical protein [Paenibacillus kobensis]